MVFVHKRPNCGDNGGRNAWGEPCRRPPLKGKLFCDMHDPDYGRCNATNADGSPCGHAPILGTRVCRLHGTTKNTRQAARERLLEANVVALRWLREAIESNDRYLAYKAAAHITRLANTQKIEVEHTGVGPPAWLKWLPLDRRAQLAEWVAEARRDMQAGLPPVDARKTIRAQLAERADDVVVDGVVTPVALDDSSS